jgi:hypothetical protein
VEETICFLNIPFGEFYSFFLMPPGKDMILTKLDKRCILDRTPWKYSFTGLGISMGYDFWERASYLHAII